MVAIHSQASASTRRPKTLRWYPEILGSWENVSMLAT